MPTTSKTKIAADMLRELADDIENKGDVVFVLGVSFTKDGKVFESNINSATEANLQEVNTIMGEPDRPLAVTTAAAYEQILRSAIKHAGGMRTYGVPGFLAKDMQKQASLTLAEMVAAGEIKHEDVCDTMFAEMERRGHDTTQLRKLNDMLFGGDNPAHTEDTIPDPDTNTPQ